MSEYQNYVKELEKRLWNYRRIFFRNADNLFDRRYESGRTPPVFKKHHESNNVILKSGMPETYRQSVLNEIPVKKRHKWFRSMKSSQALAQSVFANLKHFEKLNILGGLNGSDGKPLFIYDATHEHECHMEYSVKENILKEKEGHLTSIDVFFSGNHQIAIECKLSEDGVGPCSRSTQLKPEDEEYCDGRYAAQKGRKEHCNLSSLGIKYWDYIPELFNWSSEAIHDPCPLLETYQLVRNILVACVRPDGRVDSHWGHAVLIYDERNPAFHLGGAGRKATLQVRQGLRNPFLLQECTWQQIVDHIRRDNEMQWLTNKLFQKYGIE